MPKVLIDIEQCWCWQPKIIQPENICEAISTQNETIEIPEDLLDEYEIISRRYFEIQKILEHCYRHQEGLTPFQNSPFIQRS